MRRGALALIVVGCALAPASALARAPLSADLLLNRLVDPAAMLTPLPADVRMVMPSSHDRLGGTIDGGSYGGPVTTQGGVPPTFVRREDGGYVLMEFRQPGCLTRLFMGEANLPRGDPASFGHLQLFFDGEATPRFDEPAPDLFTGRDPRYPQPLVLDSPNSSGGNVSYVPFCFAHSLKVRTTGAPSDVSGWWQANVLLAPAGTPVRTYDPKASLGAFATRLAHGADPPSNRPDAAGDRTLALGGAGTLRHLRFTVAPFDTATLQALTLRITADGASAPQVEVPLADAFGDGLTARPVHALAFGMDPDKGTGYLALPVPFRRGVRVEVAGAAAAHVRVEGWRGPPAPLGGTLYGERREQRTVEGADTRVLDAGGSGRLAALVLDDIDGGPASGASGTQRFLEGDERVHVDGARSPVQYGTGHEESFNGGFYYIFGAFSREMGGAGALITRPDGDGAQSQYRVYADDGVRWSRGIAYGEEHGGGDEQPETVAATTFSYRWPGSLALTDTAHLGGATLTAYFEGEHDGNSTQSTVVAGGFYYPAPDPAASPEGVTLRGVRFTGPLKLRLRVRRDNRGAVLRGVFDQAPPLVPLAVRVDGKPAGVWASPTAIPNPAKRFLEDDFELPAALTARHTRLHVTLAPLDAGATAGLFGLSLLSRTSPR